MTRPLCAMACMAAFATSALAQEPVAKLTIAEAVTYALKHSPELRAARAEADAARAEAGASRAQTLPQLAMTGFAARSSMPNVLQGPMGSEPRALVLAPDGRFSDLNAMLMAPLFTGGTLQGLAAAAAALARAADSELSATRAEVALRVRETYAKALVGTHFVQAARARLDAAQLIVRNAKSLLEAGKGIEASVHRAEAERAEAQRDLTLAENDRRKDTLELLAEMGAPLVSPAELSDELHFREPVKKLAEYLAQAQVTRGELLATKLRVRAARGKVGAAAGAFLPQVYGFAMADAFEPRDMDGKRSGYSVGIAASIPIFDGGMRRSELAAAKAMLARAEAEADRLRLQVEKEVRQAWLDVETAAQNMATAAAALAGAQSAYDVITIRVETGKSILVEQLDALASLTRARANVAQALFDNEIALARLDRAVGLTGIEPTGGNK